MTLLLLTYPRTFAVQDSSTNLAFCATYRLTAAERSTNYEAPDGHEGGLDFRAHRSNSLCHHDQHSAPYGVSRLGSKGPRLDLTRPGRLGRFSLVSWRF